MTPDSSIRPKAPARLALILLLVAGFLVALAGCKNNTPSPTTVTGRIVEASNASKGIPNVLVRAVGLGATTVTDSTGFFTLQPSLSASQTLQLDISKSGYVSATVSIFAVEGQNTGLPSIIALTQVSSGGGGGNNGGGGTTTSGPASNIVVVSVGAPRIGVQHSGDNENSLVQFEVRDASGHPVDGQHRVLVQFSLGASISDGSFLSPASDSTNDFGQVSVTVNAGTAAQTLQIRAQVANSTIYSIPIQVSVHGGPPDPAHFSFGVQTFNVPGLVIYGVTDQITAFVGDRYGNPVVQGTRVYFTSTGGIIQGSGATDDHGRAPVDLITAAPAPNDFRAPDARQYDDTAGVARLLVQTVDQDGALLAQSATSVTFSGHTELVVDTTSFHLGLNETKDFTVLLRDVEHHNPLTGGTTLTVAATVGTLAGAVAVTLPDTQARGVGTTEFHFKLVNPPRAFGAPYLVAPNGHPMRLAPRAAVAGTVAPGSERNRLTPQGVKVSAGAVTITVLSANGNAQAVINSLLD